MTSPRTCYSSQGIQRNKVIFIMPMLVSSDRRLQMHNENQAALASQSTIHSMSAADGHTLSIGPVHAPYT